MPGGTVPAEFVGEESNYSGFVCRRLLHALPDRVSASRTGGWSGIGIGEFVPGKFEKSFLIDASPVWKRTALNVIRNDFIHLAH